MSPNPFDSLPFNPTWPYFGAADVVPDDVAALTPFARGLWVGALGDVAVRMLDGSEATFAAVPAGTLLPVCATQVLATGTTAGGIVGLH